MQDPITRNVNIAAMFKYFGEYAFLFFMPAYFQQVFPHMTSQFALANALSLGILAFISSLVGGIICDRYSKKKPMTNAYVCMLGSTVSLPFTLAMFLLPHNFWLSIACMSFKYLFAESWLSPAITMMQNTTDKTKQGNMISANIFYKTNAGMLSTALCGFLAFRFNT